MCTNTKCTINVLCIDTYMTSKVHKYYNFSPLLYNDNNKNLALF